ncbi:MAG TPA: DinB family protein, partial [Anaerolineales bacterium]|nr:DinB family protein [Anaerolineales bacterium]
RNESTAMDIINYLQQQFTNLNGLFHALADDLTEAEWDTRPAPGQNRIGYLVWHLPRTQDHFLHTWIRAQSEIAHRERWAGWHALKPLGIGIGITLAESDEITRLVRCADAMAYADEVHEAILAWLAGIREADLDKVPDARQCLMAFPEYQTPGYLAEVGDIFDLPVWNLLMKPCMGHAHRHLGELEILKDIVRKAR